MCTYQRWHQSNGGAGKFGVCGEYIVSREWYGEKKATPIWDYIYQLKLLPWALNCKHNIHDGKTTTGSQPNNTDNKWSNSKNISIVVPYIHGLGKRFKRTCNNFGIQVHFKGSYTLKTLHMAPNDQDSKLQESQVIYRFKCPHINFPEEYIGESGRSFRDKLTEHLRASPPYTIIAILQDIQ